MALQQTLSHLGFSLPSAYLKVSTYTGNKHMLSFSLDVKATQGSAPLTTKVYSCQYDLDGPSPLKQAYLHLKTLPEFSDAVDC
jgi:hypothetical protein